MSFYEEIKNKVVSDNYINNTDENFIPAQRINMNYLKHFYRKIKGYSDKKPIEEELIVKYFAITDNIYPVYYFETMYIKRDGYYTDFEISYVTVYNNGCILKSVKSFFGKKEIVNEIEIDKKLKYIVDNGKGIVTNKIIKFIYRCYGRKSDVNLCNKCEYCESISYNTLHDKINHYIDTETIKEGYNYKLCKYFSKNKVNCLIIDFAKENPIFFTNYDSTTNVKCYNYIITENINNVNDSKIENIILEMINDQNTIPEYLRLAEIINKTEKLYTRLKEKEKEKENR